MSALATDEMPAVSGGLAGKWRVSMDDAGYRRRFVDFLKRQSADLQLASAAGSPPVLWHSPLRRQR